MRVEMMLVEKRDFKYIKNEVFDMNDSPQLIVFQDGYKLMMDIHKTNICKFLDLDELIYKRKKLARQKKQKNIEEIARSQNRLVHYSTPDE